MIRVCRCVWTHVGVELVVLCRQNHLLQVFTDPRDSGEVDPVVVESQQLVDHRLVRPLQETGDHIKLETHFNLLRSMDIKNMFFRDCSLNFNIHANYKRRKL